LTTNKTRFEVIEISHVQEKKKSVELINVRRYDTAI